VSGLDVEVNLVPNVRPDISGETRHDGFHQIRIHGVHGPLARLHRLAAIREIRLDGEWHIDTCTVEADLQTYEGLHLAWRVFLSDDPLSAPVVGDGEKVEEAFKPIPSSARFPVRLVGTKEINSVSLTGRFEGARRASTGRFEFHPTLSKRLFSGYIPFYQRNADVLEGSFAFTAGNARGPARAVRLTDGKMPEGVAAFACKAPAPDLLSE
tara:strand:+ start:487 stop:1119 length:633 start_codon:yes stop_codon:yes gene_type:complete